MTRTTITRALRAIALLYLLAIAALLAACGGGDPEEEQDKPTPRVDCQREPEKCR